MDRNWNGVLSPGEMGAAIGGELVAVGQAVCWSSAGRSDASIARAGRAGLEDVGTVEALAASSGVILAVCPPQAALEVAHSIAGFGGVYVDANAIAPGTAAGVARVVQQAGASYVDSGSIGPPPGSSRATSLCLSGERAPEIARLFAATTLQANILRRSRSDAQLCRGPG